MITDKQTLNPVSRDAFLRGEVTEFRNGEMHYHHDDKIVRVVSFACDDNGKYPEELGVNEVHPATVLLIVEAGYAGAGMFYHERDETIVLHSDGLVRRLIVKEMKEFYDGVVIYSCEDVDYMSIHQIRGEFTFRHLKHGDIKNIYWQKRYVGELRREYETSNTYAGFYLDNVWIDWQGKTIFPEDYLDFNGRGLSYRDAQIEVCDWVSHIIHQAIYRYGPACGRVRN